jgi:TIR domain
MSALTGGAVMRVFLSFHSPDRECALALKTAIEEAQPSSEVFVDQTGLRYGHLWQPALFDAIAKSTAFIILVSNQLGDWQKVEYYEARDRKVRDDDYVLLPIVIADKAKGPAANLPGLAQLHWIETTEPAAPEPLSGILGALSSKAVPKPPEPWRIINPYRGLLALEEQDADFFFGRDLETALVLDAVLSKPGRLIALIGNSGVGKSSLVQAGVIGSLKRQRWPGVDYSWPPALKDSRSWAFLSMRPGEDPIEALASTFASVWFADATNPDRVARRKKWAAMLKSGEAGFSDLIQTTDARFETELGLAPPPRFFIYIDQGEELYSRVPKDRIKPFSQLIADGVSQPRLVMMTSQRSDYYGALQANDTLFPLTERIDVPPLGPEALKAVLREPARVLGVELESDDLIEKLVGSAESQPGALPLLADLFTDLWERMQQRGDGMLRVSDRREIIQVGAALSRRADEFVARYPTRADEVKRVFTLRLAHVPRVGEPVRRQMVRWSEREEEWQLAQTLAGPEWRLLVTGENERGEATAEVAHEILFRTWLTLKQWLEREREFLVWRDELESRLQDYQRTSKPRKREALLMGLQLTQAEQWLNARGADIDPPERRFIEESRERELVRKRNRFVAATIAFVALSAFAAFTALSWKAAEAARNEARGATSNALDLASKTAGKVRESLSNGTILTRSARELLPSVASLLDSLQTLSGSLDIRHQQVTLLLNMADIDLDLGNESEAIKHVLKAKDLTLQLSDIQTEKTQRYLYDSSFRLGDALTGAKAREQYIVARDIAARFAAEGQSKFPWKLSLARALDKVGDTYIEERNFEEAREQSTRALVIAGGLTDLEKASAEWKHQESASHNRIADAWRKQSGPEFLDKELLNKALKEYTIALEISSEVAQQERKAPDRQFTLAVRHDRMGLIFRLLQDHASEAESEFKKGLEIREKLVQRDPTNARYQRHLAASYVNLGELYLNDPTRIGDSTTSFANSLKIIEGLVERDPDNVEWQTAFKHLQKVMLNRVQ